MIGTYSDTADIRMVIAGLAIRAGITWPAVITATGRAAPSQHAIVPAGTWPAFALLPHVDYVDCPEARPGAGIVGTRAPALAPYLRPGMLPACVALPVTGAAMPQTRLDILRWLRRTSGLHWAPGALVVLAGWEDAWLACWLDRLREAGPEGTLIVAHAQATLALRKMWLAVVWRTPICDDLVPESGAVAVARALIDMTAVLLHLHTLNRRAGHGSDDTNEAMDAVLTRVERIVGHIREADRAATRTRARNKLSTAIKIAKTLLNAVAMFSVADEPLGTRWWRIKSRLSVSRDTADPSTFEQRLVVAETALNRSAAADLGRRLEGTCWRSHIRRVLLRLALPDRSTRLALLLRIRTDLIYQLAVTHRLDRLYELFPWAAAPHGAFLGCAGGALGALASLLECGRALEVAGEQSIQTIDEPETPEEEQRRLDAAAARAVYSDQRQTFLAVALGSCAGHALVGQVMSHAMVRAMMAGRFFGAAHPVTQARFGRVTWALGASINPYQAAGRRTFETVTAVTLAHTIYNSRAKDADLPRFMGRTLIGNIAAALRMIFRPPTTRDMTVHREDAIHHALKRRQARPSGIDTDRATLEARSSMLKTLDSGVDDQNRDALAHDVVLFDREMGEVGRAERLRADASSATKHIDLGTGGSHPDGRRAGQGLRRDVNRDLKPHHPRAATLERLIDDVRIWRGPLIGAKAVEARAKGKAPLPAPDDDLFEDLMRGRANLAQLSPVADLFYPVLWFAPEIDRDRLRVLMRGAPAAGMAPASPSQYDRLLHEIGRVHAWAPLLFARALPTPAVIPIMCNLFTAYSPVTWDPAHIR